MTAKAASISVKIESNNYESNCDSGSEYMDLSSPDDSGEDDALGKVKISPLRQEQLFPKRSFERTGNTCGDRFLMELCLNHAEK